MPDSNSFRIQTLSENFANRKPLQAPQGDCDMRNAD